MASTTQATKRPKTKDQEEGCQYIVQLLKVLNSKIKITCREQQMSKISHAMASPAVGFMYENFMQRIKLPKYVLSFDSTNLVR
ncbi:hypothetical protein OUZ56_005912 [Daphnia magna]|uniref:Uncharacterized protein n=1 Tax=Daphnia magna TaxID=35525 RepID=A0ABQ9YU36_9CRUS|nr:hypothetical protein OUZ56_005912 [Daphnia magna]